MLYFTIKSPRRKFKGKFPKTSFPIFAMWKRAVLVCGGPSFGSLAEFSFFSDAIFGISWLALTETVCRLGRAPPFSFVSNVIIVIMGAPQVEMLMPTIYLFPPPSVCSPCSLWTDLTRYPKSQPLTVCENILESNADFLLRLIAAVQTRLPTVHLSTRRPFHNIFFSQFFSSPRHICVNFLWFTFRQGS